MKEKIKRYSLISAIILIPLILVTLYFLFIFDIGLNSKYFVKRDFTKAFLLRQTGDCYEFKKYILPEKAEGWVKRCEEEKDREGSPIKNFSIKNFTKRSNEAFLQVELTRDIRNTASLELEKYQLEALRSPYVVNYSLVKGSGENFLKILPTSRWLINQEIR